MAADIFFILFVVYVRLVLHAMWNPKAPNPDGLRRVASRDARIRDMRIRDMIIHDRLFIVSDFDTRVLTYHSAYGSAPSLRNRTAAISGACADIGLPGLRHSYIIRTKSLGSSLGDTVEYIHVPSEEVLKKPNRCHSYDPGAWASLAAVTQTGVRPC